jgi:large subunit ribosomal protein L5
MHFLEHYYNTIIKYDLVYKFNYKNLKKIPKLNKIFLNFGCKTFELKKLTTSLLALQLLTSKKGNLTISKKANIILKIREGTPVGCSIILSKKEMYKFLGKLIFEILPKLKNKNLIKTLKTKNALTYNFSNPLIFKEFEKNYLFFNSLKNLQITFITNTSINEELFFLLNSFKFKTKVPKTNSAKITQ